MDSFTDSFSTVFTEVHLCHNLRSQSGLGDEMEPSTGWWELGEERGQAVRKDEWRALLVPLPREEKGVLLLQVPLCPPALAPVVLQPGVRSFLVWGPAFSRSRHCEMTLCFHSTL